MILKVVFLILCACAWGALAAGGGGGGGGGGEFPAGFRFGAASASYQVEGAWNHSDKGESVWDRWTHTRPELTRGATGDVACDSFRLWETDVRLAKELGLHFYRFSISWPRLLPTGFANRVSETGARYYNQLIDGLRAEGIDAAVTLYHWDLPQALQDLGGWTNPLIVQWFEEYARVAFSLFGDRVPRWLTLNEAIVMCDLTYTSGALPPGVRDARVAPHLCVKHALLAHAAAFRLYDKEFRPKYHGKVSLAQHSMWYEPLTDSAADAKAAELTMQFSLGRYSHAIFGPGGWPPAVEKLIAANSKAQGYPRSRLPEFTPEEVELVRGTFDFFALNHYTSRAVAAPAAGGAGAERGAAAGGGSAWGGFPLIEWEELPAVFSTRDWPRGCNDWLYIYPEGLRKLLGWIKRSYGDVPIVITESGFPTCGEGSALQDAPRVRYYRQYLRSVLDAIREDAVNVTGYTAWTLLDNFEWGDGFETKFGLYEVDFSSPSRPRTARRSARYYAQVIRHHSLDVGDGTGDGRGGEPDFERDEL